MGQSLGRSLLLSPWSRCTQVLFVPSKSLFPQSCVSSVGSMVGLMAASSKWAYAIARYTAPRTPTPDASVSSSGDTQTQFFISLCGVSRSWCVQGMFEPSDCLWKVQGLILNVILPLIPCSWGFSFALGHGVSPQSHSSSTQLPLQHLPSFWGF